MGILQGLGQGLQGMGQQLGQGMELDARAKQEAIQRAIQMQQFQDQLKQQQAVQERLAQAAEFNNNFKVASNLPGGTELDPQTQQSWRETGLSPLMEAQQSLPSQDLGEQMPQPPAGGGGNMDGGVPALLQHLLSGGGAAPGGQAGPQQSTPELVAGTMKAPKPTGRVVSVETEDSRARTAEANRQATQQRVAFIYDQKTKIANAANALKAQIENAKLKDPNRLAALDIQRERLKQQWAQLETTQQGQQNTEDWRYNVQLPDILNDNETATYRAENAGTGGAPKAPGMTGADLVNAMGGGTPTAPKAPVGAPPVAKRPPLKHSPDSAVGPTPGVKKFNAHGDPIMWDGKQWVLDPEGTPRRATVGKKK